MEAPITADASRRSAHRRSTENRSVGNLFEAVAARWLGRRGYRVVARQVRIAGVEIDLVVRRKGTLALVEVRGRSSESGIRPRDAVGADKWRRLERAGRATFRKERVTELRFVEVVGPAPPCLRRWPWLLWLSSLRRWRVETWRLEP